MANPNKKKGTRAETKVRKFLEGLGYKATRQALSGNADQGDLLIRHNGKTYIVEVKAGKQTASPNRTQLDEWKRQTLVEQKNAKANDSFLVVVRYNRNINDADVYKKRSNNTWLHFYLDEFFLA